MKYSFQEILNILKKLKLDFFLSNRKILLLKKFITLSKTKFSNFHLEIKANVLPDNNV